MLATPVLAGPDATEQKLESAKDRLAAIQKEVDKATAALQAAYDRYHETQGLIQDAKAAIERTRARITRIRETLAARARSAYQVGAGGTIELLLSSSSFTEFTDRIEFLGAMAENDTTLVVKAQVNTERLRRDREALAELAEEQAATVEELEVQEAAVQERLDEAQAIVNELTQKLREERAAERKLELLGIAVNHAGALRTCPVHGPNSFVDSWGAPRSGGRSHQGTDLIAALGTPLVAVQDGTVTFGSSSLGGLSAYLYADNGDFFYYAHMSSFGTGGHVSAGREIIGYVGSTGNAGETNHLHFEYHPGNGPAVNPYPYLVAVC